MKANLGVRSLATRFTRFVNIATQARWLPNALACNCAGELVTTDASGREWCTLRRSVQHDDGLPSYIRSDNGRDFVARTSALP
jgi:hypothetical protein